ncbi:prolyl-tRNA editing protein ProX [bacterium MnTg02]|nr:prolyl-tRNA editing protein ProX [bacterium MnTg02]
MIAQTTRAELLAYLSELGIETKTTDHPPLHTVDESRALRGDIPGSHTKNLFLKCKKNKLWLVVTLEDANVDLKILHRLIGSGRLSFGKPDLLIEALGVPPGSVTPFALINDKSCRVNVVLDQTMMQRDPLNYHPLENNATTTIGSEDLLTFIRATGHDPVILSVAE